VSYPLHLDVSGRRVLVVGAGPVAARRVRGLLAAGAEVEVVAPEVSADFPAVPLQRRAFQPSDVDGAWLVHACTGVVDEVVAAACEERRVWCVRADDASLSKAWVPAVARADEVVVSVTAGRDPRRAMALRDAISLALDTGALPLRRVRAGTGSVTLVGGGPGDPGLLTVKARQLLAGADVVVRDRLAPQIELPDDVEVVDVGKIPGGPSYDQRAIEALLVDRARAGQRVVRLKGGDVHVFGRGIEEVAACVEAGVPVEVVPGVSSAFSVPAYAGIPVTARGITQSVSVVSAHLPPGHPGSTVDWDALAKLKGTLVLLMGVERLTAACAALVAGGRPGSTPVAEIRNGTLPTQTVAYGTLDTAGDLDVQAPSVVVIGEVVAARLP
jgi:uroporphyrin-III C-methyltransferase/precorrin-2 dehydrogenase/sirohydrochlorin ferrochelatase